MGYKTLIVEDDAVQRLKTAHYFKQAGYTVFEATDSNEMNSILTCNKIDLIVLDLKLPGIDGIQIAQKLRATSDIAIIMVTGQTDQIDVILGLEVGADDYVMKPVNMRELLIRARNLLWRIQLTRDALYKAETAWAQLEKDDSVYSFLDFKLDVKKRTLEKNNESIEITKAEFELLLAFITHPFEVMGRERLLSLISHRTDSPSDRTIDVLVRRLRAKMEDDRKKPRIFATCHGEGYFFAADVK